MPHGDGMGRLGRGSMTGRGMGYCAGFDMPGYMNGRPGFLGRGRGFGRGFGYDTQAQADALALHVQRLEEELATVKNRLAILAKDSDTQEGKA